MEIAIYGRKDFFFTLGRTIFVTEIKSGQFLGVHSEISGKCEIYCEIREGIGNLLGSYKLLVNDLKKVIEILGHKDRIYVGKMSLGKFVIDF